MSASEPRPEPDTALLEHLPFGVTHTRADLRVTYMNCAAEATTGFARHRVLHRDVREIVDQDTAREIDRQHALRQRGIDLPFRIRLEPEPEKPVEVIVIPRSLGDGARGADVLSFVIDAAGFEGALAEAAADAARLAANGTDPDHSGRLSAADRRELLSGLSHREREVATEIARGTRIPILARRLELSERTVRNHLHAAFRKLGVHSQADLVLLLKGGTVGAD